MPYYEIELTATDGWVKRYLVKAKTYEDACAKVAKIDGDGKFKLLGLFEPMEIDKNILKRYG